jgi:sporulation protein YlmC with PRC-barrel domain
MPAVAHHQSVLPVAAVVGNAVHNPYGENLGVIKEIVVDLTHGRIAYAVLAFGGFLGFGDKLFAVPWSALSYTASDETFTLKVTREQLEQAPGFDKEHWPDLADRAWAGEVHYHYGAAPYWDD